MDVNIKDLILKKYLDMTYIHTILCQYHYEWYNKLNMIVMFPAIIGSGILTILNSSSINDEILKIINISINGFNTILITLSNQYKLNDRLNYYKNSYIKFNKLQHKIESFINNPETINDKSLDDIINEYDGYVNDSNYSYLSSYKKKIVENYGKSRQLPNSLALDLDNQMLCETKGRQISSSVGFSKNIIV